MDKASYAPPQWRSQAVVCISTPMMYVGTYFFRFFQRGQNCNWYFDNESMITKNIFTLAYLFHPQVEQK